MCHFRGHRSTEQMNFEVLKSIAMLENSRKFRKSSRYRMPLNNFAWPEKNPNNKLLLLIIYIARIDNHVMHTVQYSYIHILINIILRRQAGGFLRVLRFPTSIKLTTMI
jgi:hypothetical protein